MQNETLVPLVGAMNCRDVGGYGTIDGRRVRRGQIFRSDNLATLTDADLDVLSGHRIRAVYDLRYEAEISERPSRLWDTVAHHEHLPMAGDLAQQGSFMERVMSGAIAEVTLADVTQSYVEILEDHAIDFGQLLTWLAESDRRPSLYHCTAGKDRTGIATALIHELLGVDRSDTLDDYGLSERYRVHRRIAELMPTFAEAGVDIEAIRPALSAPRPAMASLLATIDTGGAMTVLIPVEASSSSAR